MILILMKNITSNLSLVQPPYLFSSNPLPHEKLIKLVEELLFKSTQ